MRKVLFATFLLQFVFISVRSQSAVTGKVIDLNSKEPVANASVSVSGKEISSACNFKGFFQVNAAVGDVLIVEAEGYQTKEVKLTVSGGVLISVRKKFVAPYEGGDTAIYRFIVENLNYPATARNESRQGKVYVSFQIEPGGRASEFNVVKDIGGGCGKEVIRVLKKIPNKWKVTESTTFILPVTFQMEQGNFDSLPDSQIPLGQLMTELVVTGYKR